MALVICGRVEDNSGCSKQRKRCYRLLLPAQAAQTWYNQLIWARIGVRLHSCRLIVKKPGWLTVWLPSVLTDLWICVSVTEQSWGPNSGSSFLFLFSGLSWELTCWNFVLGSDFWLLSVAQSRTLLDNLRGFPGSLSSILCSCRG